MANSKFEYVKVYERHMTLLPSTFIVVRIDGRGFHRLSKQYQFEKPNDRGALALMNASAVAVMKELPDICMAYGVSDEYSFVFSRSTELFERRESKLVTTVVSTFTSNYVYLWPQFLPLSDLSSPLPSFDGRAIEYPNAEVLRDYMSWRQADCHINNLYNTTFWNLVLHGGLAESQAEETLRGTVSSDKNEILFSKFSINYNKEPEIFKKGTIIYRNHRNEQSNESKSSVAPHSKETNKTQREKERKRKQKAEIVEDHVDIIQDAFWEDKPWLLS